jgi:hypothetical protein
MPRSLQLALKALVYFALALPVALGLAAGIVTVLYNPVEIEAGAHWAALGVALNPCLGCAMCGMTRAFSSVMHGNFSAAMDFNPLVVVMFPAVMLSTIAAGYAIAHFTRKPLQFAEVM